MQDLQERVITCPECLADNTFVADYQSADSLIYCSHCGAFAGTWADTRQAHARPNKTITGQAKAVPIIRGSARSSAKELDPAEEIRVPIGLDNGKCDLNR